MLENENEYDTVGGDAAGQAELQRPGPEQAEQPASAGIGQEPSEQSAPGHAGSERPGTERERFAAEHAEPEQPGTAQPGSSGADAPGPEPSGAEAPDSEAAGAAVPGPESSRPEFSGAGVPDPELPGLEPGGAGRSGLEFSGAEASAPESPGTGVPGSESAGAGASGSEPSGSESSAPEPSGADASGAEPSAAGQPATGQAPSARALPEVITTRTLFFLQPDLPPVPRGQERRRARDEEPRARQGREAREPKEAAQEPREQEPRAGRRARGRRPRPERQDEPVLVTEPQKVKGSTRLEAKRQRRREGRESGRRRPVVTESEFLARREAVDRTMLVRAKDQRVQIGVLEDKVLVEHYVARSSESSLIGNVYLGRVQNVLPSMEAAFVDIGRGRNAVLYSGEVDWEAAQVSSGQARRIENALKPGDKVLVQVTKDPVGHKGARLTSQVSLPGRYLVYVPGNSMHGISRKLPDTERSRLKKILKEVLPAGTGVIVRTAAEGATQEQLERDVRRLTAQWESISSRVASGHAPALLHSEPDLLIKIIRDVFNEDFQKLIIQGATEMETISSYLEQVAPDLLDRVESYEGNGDLFAEHRAAEAIEKALERKVWLPSGGSLVIDRTEAMTVVDVNTGKFVGSGGNLEETVTKNNLEAAEEVVRQLRLRDIGGIIVIDFIDMVLESNRDLVLRRLVECLSRDRTKHQVAEVTSLGLIQMTRKKIGLGLLETFSEACESCAGRGMLVSGEPVDRQRGQGDAKQGRRSRGTQKAKAQSTSTHGITDEARGALSKIAASTIAGGKPGEAAQPATQAPAEEAEPGKAKRSRRGRRRAQAEAGAAGDEGQAMIELPEAKAGAAPSAEPDPAGLAQLDSLLDSIAEEASPEAERQASPGRGSRSKDPARSEKPARSGTSGKTAQPGGPRAEPAQSELAQPEPVQPAQADPMLPEAVQQAEPVQAEPAAPAAAPAEPQPASRKRGSRRRVTTAPVTPDGTPGTAA